MELLIYRTKPSLVERSTVVIGQKANVPVVFSLLATALELIVILSYIVLILRFIGSISFTALTEVITFPS